MKKIVPYLLGMVPLVLLFLIVISCTNTKISEQMQMDINDLQNQLLVYRKKQNQMTIILEQLHSEFLLNNDNSRHLENRLKAIEHAYESIMDQIVKIQPAEINLMAEEAFSSDYLEMSSPDDNHQGPLDKNPQKSIRSILRPINQNHDADKLYDQSLSDVQKGNVDSAIRGFQDYLTRFPGSPLCDNAEYWLAECFYKQKKFDLAIKHFQRVIDRFPKGNKVPAATLKLGYTFFEIGDYNKSLAHLKTVMEKYPDSQELILAQKKADKIITILNNVNNHK